MLRRDEVVGQPAQDGVGGADRPAGEREVGAELPGAAASRWVPPTSGTKPIAVSGIATRERSVTTRTSPWADTPTPPPITMPSMSATYGLGKRAMRALSRYSSRQKSTEALRPARASS